MFGTYACDFDLVFRPADIVGFSVAMVFRSKAQCAGNGCSFPKCCNAAAGCHGNALWVSLSMPMDCVDPLDKGAPLPTRHALP